MENGALCVLVIGMTRMPGSYADSLVFPEDGKPKMTGLQRNLVLTGCNLCIAGKGIFG